MSANSNASPEGQTLKGAAYIGALGIVFGDIGTSPLYAYKEALRAAASSADLQAIVYGCVSLVFWALIIVVSIKYVTIVMRATNGGEGGIMALTALTITALKSERWRHAAVLCGLTGAALFYGDCVITPAISVLSAVEGLEFAAPALKPYIVPLAAAILAGLFLFQRRGTAHIGRLFGPIMLVWFAAIGAAGLFQILKNPEIAAALNPVHGLRLITGHGWTGFHVLGSVFLVLTGAEALYADEGHFHGSIIRRDWFAIVLPCLVLNYGGQGAHVLADPSAAANPFYMLFPNWALYPAVLLATVATVIASQAVISGAFTMTQQAMALGFLQRMEIRFTSRTEASQIYIPQVNWFLAAAVLALVLSFKSSDALAGAYGVAVSMTMLATTLLVTAVARHLWGWSLGLMTAVIPVFLIVDTSFFAANLAKIFEGGYVPLLLGALMLFIMMTWHRGRTALFDRIARENPPLGKFWDEMNCGALVRVPGVAAYLTASGDRAPSSLSLNVKHNKCLHETVVLLTINIERVPRIAPAERVTSEALEHGFLRVTLRYGFAETPAVHQTLQDALQYKVHLGFEMDKGLSYFAGRAIPIPSPKPDLPAWREPLFIFLMKNTATAATFFLLPPEQVVELGTFVEI
jgi:KUP system potassium uptake protein